MLSITKIFKQGIFILVLLLCWHHAGASHIVGGELTYTKKDSGRYEIKLVLFVDCINGQPRAIAQDQFANIGIFNANLKFKDSFSIERVGPTRIDNANYTCIVPPSNACVDMYVYTKTIKLKDTVGGYILAYQRCCRNMTITNIINPDRTGTTYFTKIPGTSVTDSNSAATFKSLPPNFLCVNQSFEFDHAAEDADGDSLVYELYTPYAGADPMASLPRPPAAPNYYNIQWRSSYSARFALGTNSTFKIDSLTGKLTFLPKTLGQFVAGIAVKEYRNGILVGETRRDYQFNVLPCEFSVKANFTAPQVYCRKEIQFTNLGRGDSFMWDFGIVNSQKDTSTALNPVFTFPANGTYKVWQVAISGNCTDSFSREIIIKDPKDYFFAIYDTTICYGKPVSLGTTSVNDGYSISWWPNKWLSNTNTPNPVATPLETTTYYVSKTFQQCTYTDSVTIKVDHPLADFSAPGIFCRNDVSFTNTGSADSYFWDFGVDSSKTDTSTAANPVFTFPGTGTYKVKLFASTGLCTDSVSRDITIYSLEKYALAIEDTTICAGQSLPLGIDFSTQVYKATWLPDKWLDDNTLHNPVASPQESITYIVTKTFLNCEYRDTVKITVHNPKAGFTAPDSTCTKQITFTNTGSADSFYWDFGVEKSETDTSTAKNPVFTFPANGTYQVQLRAKTGHCTTVFSKPITILDPADYIFAINDTAICYGEAVTLGTTSANPGYAIYWSPEKWLSNSNIPSPVAKPLETITYKVTKAFKDCIETDSVTITVNNPVVEMTYEVKQHCDRNEIIFNTQASDSVKYFWYVDDEIVSTEANPVMTYPYGKNISGYLFTSAAAGCNDSKPFQFDFPEFNSLDFLIPNVITPNGDGQNECFGAIIKNYDIKCSPEMYIYNRWGELVFRNDKNCWDGTDSRNGNPLAEGAYFYVLTIAGKTYHGTVTLLR